MKKKQSEIQEEIPEDESEFSDENSESQIEDSEEPESEERKMYKAVCSECGAKCEVPFEPEEGKPVKCKECYIKSRPQRRNFGRDRRFDRRPRQMYPAKCAKCRKNCEVPFKPNGEKPVLCKECYIKSKESA